MHRAQARESSRQMVSLPLWLGHCSWERQIHTWGIDRRAASRAGSRGADIPGVSTSYPITLISNTGSGL